MGFRLRIASAAAAGALAGAFLALSAWGYASTSAPGDPPIRVSGCWRGFWPTLAFGPGMTFGVLNERFGPDFYRTHAIGVSWPGGALGAFIVPVCPSDIPGPEADHAD